MCLLSLSLVACSDKDEIKDPEDPTQPVTPVNPEDYQTVPVAGATLTNGDITITFPESTFKEETDIAITEVKNGDVLGTDEVSKFYQLTIPPQIDKPLAMSIKCDEVGSGLNVIAHVPCYSLSEDILGYQDIILESDYSNGTYTFTLPANDNDDFEEDEKLAISFGVAKVDYLGQGGPAAVKATRAPVFDEKFTEGNVSWHFSFGFFQKYELAQSLTLYWDDINDCIRDAIKILHGLGLKVTERDVTFSFAKIKEYGRFNQSAYCNEWSSIQVGTHVLKDFANSRDSFRSTIIHELMHLYQADYDPRCAFRKADKLGSASEKIGGIIGDGAVVHDGSERLLLYESGAVWAEQFMIGHFNYGYATSYVGNFIKGFYDIGEIYTSGTRHSAYESHGYGMSVFMQYITRNMTEYNLDDKSVVKLYNIWHETNGWTRDCIKKLTGNAGHDIFINYEDFLLALLKGEVDGFINVTGLDGINSGGKMTDKTLSLQADGKCFAYGCQIDRFQIDISDDIPLVNKQLVIDQQEEGADTYVLIPTIVDGKSVPVQYGYKAWKDSPIILEGKELYDKYHRADRKATQLMLFAVTMNRSNSSTKPYKVEVALKDGVSVTPDSIGFGPEGGSQNVKINCGDYKRYGAAVKEEGWGWCGLKAPGNNEIQIIVQPNNTSQPRECIVECYVTNEENPEDKDKVKLPVKVTQKPGEQAQITVTRARLEMSFWWNITTINNGESSEYQKEVPLYGGGTNDSPSTITASYINGTTLHVEFEKEEDHGQTKETLTFDIVDFPDIAKATIQNLVLIRHSEKNPEIDDWYQDFYGYDEYVYDIEASFEPLSYAKAYSGRDVFFAGYPNKGMKVYSATMHYHYVQYGSTKDVTYNYLDNDENNAWMELEWEKKASAAPRHSPALTPWSTFTPGSQKLSTKVETAVTH